MMLKSSGDRGHACLVLYFNGTALKLSPLSMILAVVFVDSFRPVEKISL